MLAAARSIRPSVPQFCELALPLVVRLELGHDALAKDAQGAFRTLFGDAFAKAYEEQLERLQGLARGREK